MSSAFAAARAKLEQKWSPELERRIQTNLRSDDSEGANTFETPEISLPESRFDLRDSAGWLEYLEAHGYVVVSGVLQNEELQHAKALLWEYLETQGMQQHNPASWTDHFPGDRNTGICPVGGAPHCDFAWYVRSHPAVLDVFQKVWGEEDLISSFDAINIFRPFAANPELKTRGGWLHLDQNAYPPGQGKSGRHCVQGLVTVLDASASTGSLVVVPDSQHRHEEFCSRAKCASGDFVPLEHNGVPQEELFRDSRPTMVAAMAGDLILWDSRTVHANTPALQVSHAAEELLRIVCYTCLTPRAWASDECIRMRQRAFEGHIGGTHWPHEFKARGDLSNVEEGARRLDAAPEAIRRLVGEPSAPLQRPSDEAMAAMQRANQLESEGDLAGSKEWIEKAKLLGHNCLAEYGGWK